LQRFLNFTSRTAILRSSPCLPFLAPTLVRDQWGSIPIPCYSIQASMTMLTHCQENIACFEHFDLLTVGPVAKPATLAPQEQTTEAECLESTSGPGRVQNTLQKKSSLDGSRCTSWAHSNSIPFMHMSEGQLHFGKGQNHGRPFLSPHPTRGQWQATVPQADVETATLQPKEDPA